MATKLALHGGQPVRTQMLPLTIPFFDQEDAEALQRALASTMVSGDGPDCRAFEQELAAYLGVKHVFFTTSCTAALDLAFMVVDFPPGSDVLVPDFTFTSTALAPIMNGLKVVLVDVRADNGNIDVAKAEASITSRTVGIAPVDYAGNPAELAPLLDLARRHGLYVVHVAAQSIGAAYRGRKTGGWADVTCFSFHATKNLVVGEGGALVTDRDDLVDRILIARDKGTDKHRYLSGPLVKGYYEYVARGNSYVQSNLLGALGRTQLRKLDRTNARRREIADFYLQEFAAYPHVRLPGTTEGAQTNWHVFYLLIKPVLKEWFIDALRAEGVMANIHYHPLHLSPYYRKVCDLDAATFPGATDFFAALVRLPLYAGMSDQDARDVVMAVRKVLDHAPQPSGV